MDLTPCGGLKAIPAAATNRVGHIVELIPRYGPESHDHRPETGGAKRGPVESKRNA